MTAIYKITENLYDETFALVALHSSLEDYALVYALNLHLKSGFKRCFTDLDLSAEVSFPIFEWKDKIQHRYWTLISNSSSTLQNIDQGGLFQNESTYTKHYLIPEYKEVDFFLKIEQDETEVEEEVLNMIHGIPKVVTAYTIPIDRLKSKNNLIF